MFNYEKYIEEHSREFGSCPFWSWNDKLETDELKRQIDDMKKSGMSGFFMHARGGLQTEYFSEEWFHAIKTCVDYAKEQGMQAWLYDENGWPSGFANRKLLEDSRNWSSYLKIKRSEDFPNIVNDEFSEGILAVYSMRDGKPTRLTVADNSKEYILIMRCFEGSYVDTLNSNITQLFLQRVYAEYCSRFPDDFGKEHMPGFFTDEPQYFRYATPWSSVIPQAFCDKYGYDVLDALPALFLDYDGACEKRYDYWNLLHELFINNWIRPVYEWCEAHNCKLTGHAIEESSLHTQMWCSGGVMPFYEYEHIPGVDHLGRNIDSGLEAKQVGSVAAQLGKKRVLAEIFACSGCDTTPMELKGIGDSMYVDGVNFICQHLYPYSSRGERKYDHPLHFSELLPWNEHMSKLNEYFNQLGCLLSLGKDVTNVLVLHPMHSAYLYYRREEDRDSIATLETSFAACMNQLWSEQILFHLGDETLIRKYGSVVGSSFVVGKCNYDVVVMPDMDSIDLSTAKLLDEYLQNGGKLLCMGRTPKYLQGQKCDLDYQSNISLYELKAKQLVQVEYHGNQRNMLKYAVRVHDNSTIVFLTNLTDKPMHQISVSVSETPINLEAYGSCVLLDGKTIHSTSNIFDECKKVVALDNQYYIEKPVENYLVLDYARVSFDGRKYSDKKPMALISQELLEMRREGDVWLQFEYHASGTSDNLHLILEPQQYREIAVNGISMREKENDWKIDRRFIMYDIGNKVKLGNNTIEICFHYYQNQDIYNIYFGNGTESLRNCMSFDTEVSPIYLMGNFEIQSGDEGFWQENNALCHKGEFSLTWQNDIVRADNLTISGYPFFYGKIKLKKTFIASQKTKAIKLEGRFSACEIWLNGCYVDVSMFDRRVNISSYVREGENELVLVLYSSARNLIGPFHHEDAESFSVFPTKFTFENCWKNGNCKEFANRYAFVPFGVEAYLLETE